MSKKEFYSGFTGIVRGVNPVDVPQISFSTLDNYVPTDKRDAIVKRGGSDSWTATGSILGLGEYSEQQAAFRAPNISYVFRHRRDSTTSYIEHLNWQNSTWTNNTLGAQALSANFSSDAVASFFQQRTLLGICGGRPAKLASVTGTVERLGGPAPATAPTIGTSGTGLTGEVVGFYTFYDSTTGWESSPSPITSVGTVTNKQLDWSALETTCAREGVDQKRLYRYQIATGEGPGFLVATIALATTTYTDTVADASLGIQAPDANDHDPPPTSSFLGCSYANRFWIASGSDLYYSKADDGNNYQLEYYSSSRLFRFPQKITGLAYSPQFGKLLVFQPSGKGIHYIAGRSESTFEQDEHRSDGGTDFPSSVSVKGEMIAFWDSGPRIITPSGYKEGYGDNAKDDILDIVNADQDGDVWVWSVWHEAYKSFIWGLSATSTDIVSWEDSFASSSDWENIDTGAVVTWG